jgi:hypothetical protein
MNRMLSAGVMMWAVLVTSAIFTLQMGTVLAAQTVPTPLAMTTATNVPALPYVKSPVDLFRDLLAMSPIERKNYLTNRPPQIRERILVKLHEYEVMDPNERELRLTATELRWYLPPLMRLQPADRAMRLAAIPPDTRKLVEDRLNQWDLLPPALQQEMLANEQTLSLFTRVNGSGQENFHFSTATVTNHFSGQDGLEAWNALPEEKRQFLSEQFTHFFELTPEEKNKTLSAMSDAERKQMEKTLQAFEKLPPAQRVRCIRAFEQFASMTSPERSALLKSVEQWAQMPPNERQAWIDLVAHVPQWPPMPPEFNAPRPPPRPPMPSTLPVNKRPGVEVVTNTN